MNQAKGNNQQILMKINDIVVFKDIYYQQAKKKIKNEFPPISAKIGIAQDVFIEKINENLANEFFLIVHLKDLLMRQQIGGNYIVL
ncbi:hypothetical protein ACFLT2_14360 [Acidobacteriota bacterium]